MTQHGGGRAGVAVAVEQAEARGEAPVPLVAVDGGVVEGADHRQAALARQLTKLHETIRRDTLRGLADWVGADPQQRKGEHVILVEGAGDAGHEEGEGERVLHILCEQLPVSQAAELAAKITGAARNRLYRLALEKEKGTGQ